MPSSVPLSSVPVELGVGFTFPSNNNNNKNKKNHLISQLLLTRFWPNFKSKTLVHLEQISPVTVTFVQATFLLGTFVHISNISAHTDPILTKLLGPNILGASIFVDQNFLGQNFFYTHLPPPHKLNISNISVVTNLNLTKLYKSSAIFMLLLTWFWPNFLDPIFWGP